MKKAIDSYSGVRGCRASVVKVDTCAQDLHNHNWNGVLMFSNFSNFEQTESGCGKPLMLERESSFVTIS